MNLEPFGAAAPLPPAAGDGPAKPRRSRAKVQAAAIIAGPASPPSLADDITSLEASLGRSLGVAPGPDGYSPASFVSAIHAIHDRLQGVHCELARRQAELDEREVALEAALRAVQAREQLAAASIQLAQACPSWGRPVPARGILARLFGG